MAPVEPLTATSTRQRGPLCTALTVDANQGVRRHGAAQCAVQGIVLTARAPEGLHQGCTATIYRRVKHSTTGYRQIFSI